MKNVGIVRIGINISWCPKYNEDFRFLRNGFYILITNIIQIIPLKI